MGANANADFGGYATKANVKCTDGRTITADAFKHMDKMQIPLVYNHVHDNPGNVLGHAILEARTDGVYAYGYFNNTKQGQDAKEFVEHKDIKALSIFANKLVHNSARHVLQGDIKEVSLVLGGANPEAMIDFVQLKHGDDPDDIETIFDEAVIHTGLELEIFAHADEEEEDDEEVEHADASTDGDETIADIYNTFTPKQKNVVSFMIGTALDEADGGDAAHSDDEGDDADEDSDKKLAHKEGNGTVSNVFEQANKNANAAKGGDGEVLRHAITEEDLKGLYQSAKRYGSLNAALEEYQLAHGITNIEALFPDPKLLNNTPDFQSRNMAWVQDVLDSTRKSPFSRIRTAIADITQDEARAKGYITGNMKKEEWFGLTTRTTTPTTVYKKQSLNRDDVLDIVDFDVIAWLKGEMRIMLSEEIAVSIMLGDGRAVDDPDHVADPMGASSGPGLRSIMNDDELYVTRAAVNVDDANSNYGEVVDQVLMASEFYQGTGSPTFYSTQRTINKMLLSKDGQNRRLYDDLTALAAAMGVGKIVAVEPLLRFPSVLGIVVNLTDYNIGTDRGGETTMFDQFDIDYNLMKYLMETRVSGALVRIKSAIILTKTAAANVIVEPVAPTFVQSTGIVTIPTQTGVTYKNALTSATLTGGAQTALTAGSSLKVKAVAAAGYYIATTGTPGVDEWTFKRPAA